MSKSNCPDFIKEPFAYKAYVCRENSYYIDAYISQLLINARYYQYLRTGVKNSSEYRKKFSYLVPIYKFKYYSKNTGELKKTYTYEQIFNINLIASQYKDFNRIPDEIKENFDNTDIEVYESILLFDSLDKLYNAITFANQYLQNGKEYFFTFNLPKKIAEMIRLIDPKQKTSKTYSRDELISLSRNAPKIAF